MNAADILKYGNSFFCNTLDGLPQTLWESEGVCGIWSVKNIVAHLASHEHMLIEILNSFLGGNSSPYLDEYAQYGVKFNDMQVDRRKGMSPTDTIGEYNQCHAQVMTLITRIPVETLRQEGTLPWYGDEYALDDFIVYGFYGHKREHGAQVMVYRDSLK
jgi:hypothetical protein